MFLLDDRSKLGELKGAGVKPSPHSSIASRPGLFEQPPRLSARRVKTGTAVRRPVPLA